MLTRLKQSSVSTVDSKFRRDIAGLRAVAVIAVIVYHLNSEWLPGGFAGVDVFFVLSGFLITGILWREFLFNGRISLKSFYARRARRLIPAALFLLLCTVVAVFLIYPYWLWDGVMWQAAAAALYSANILFAIQGSDYFTESLELPQPLLHMWTLGVEEQFYFILPLIVIISVAVFSGSKRKPSLIVVLSGVTVVSFAASVFLSSIQPNASFFLLHTRFWEFSIGALAAVALTGEKTRSMNLIGSWRGQVLSIVGAVGLVASFILLDGTLIYPGWAAVLPVFSTLAILVSSDQGLPNKLLSLSPMVAVGNISYSWYLWHYPPIVLLAAFPFIDSGASILLALGIGLAGAIISYFVVEKPFRFSVKRNLSPTKVVSVSLLLCITLASVLSLGGLGVMRAKVVKAGESGLISSNANESYEIAGEQEQNVGTLLPSGEKEIAAPAEETDAPSEVPEATSLAGYSVLLVGDSHSMHWEEAFRQAVEENLGGVLVTHSLLSCPAIDVYVTKLDGSRMREGCDSHREEFWELIPEYDIVVLSQAEHYIERLRGPGGERVSELEREEIWAAAYQEWLLRAAATGVLVGVVADNPRMPNNPASCVLYSDTAEDCDVSESVVRDLMGNLPAISSEVRLDNLPYGGDQVLDVYSWICSDEVCKASENGLAIFSDNQHLEVEWTRSKSTEIEQFLLSLINLRIADDTSGEQL